MESSPNSKLSSSLSPSKQNSKNIDKGKTLAETFDALTEKIPKRPAPEEIEKAGLRRSSDLAHTLQPVAAQVEKKLVEKKVAQSIKKKTQPASPNSKRIISGEEQVAGSLAATAKDLKMKMSANTVSHFLENRPTKEELKQAGVLDKASDKTSDRIINMQKALETSFTRDHVGHLLETRPKAEDLKHVSGITDPTAPSLRGRRRSLEFGISKSQLHKHMMERPDYQQLVDKGIVSSIMNEDDGQDAQNSAQTKITLALKCASRLNQLGMIDDEGKGYLKNLILANDQRVLAALDTYDSNQNLNELLDSMQNLAVSKSA